MGIAVGLSGSGNQTGYTGGPGRSGESGVSVDWYCSLLDKFAIIIRLFDHSNIV